MASGLSFSREIVGEFTWYIPHHRIGFGLVLDWFWIGIFPMKIMKAIDFPMKYGDIWGYSLGK